MHCPMLLWADDDVEFLRSLDGSELLRFARAHDVTYCPFKGFPKGETLAGLHNSASDFSADIRDSLWRVESGFMAWRPTYSALALAAAAVECAGAPCAHEHSLTEARLVRGVRVEQD